MAVSSYLRGSPLAQASSYYGDSQYGGASTAAPSKALWKEMSNQGLSDQDILSMFGPNYIQEDAGKKFYTGKIDPSEFQYGTQGLETEDIGQGKFNIKGPQGQSLGVGYKKPGEALNDIVTRNLISSISQSGDYYTSPHLGRMETRGQGIQSEGDIDQSYQEFVPDTYSSREAIEAALRSRGRSAYSPFGSELEQYKLLGDYLTGKSGIDDLVTYPNRKPIREYAGKVGSNTLSGENTLYGSDPLIRQQLGQASAFTKPQGDYGLLGYRMNMNPAAGGVGALGGLAQQKADLHGSTKSMSTLQRVFNDPEAWSKVGSALPSGNFFVKPENVSNIPGWSDQYNSKYARSRRRGGLFSKVFKILDPILDRVDPLHNPTQDMAVKLTGSGSQEEAFNKVAPIVLSFFGPWGAAANAANSASTGNMGGALMSAIGAGMGFSGYNPTSGLGSSIQGMTGFSPAVSNALASGLAGGTMSGLGSMASGGNFGQGFLRGAAGGAAGSYAGSTIGNYLNSSGLSPALTSGLTAAGSNLAGGLASSLAAGQKISPQALALSSALAGAKGYAR